MQISVKYPRYGLDGVEMMGYSCGMGMRQVIEPVKLDNKKPQVRITIPAYIVDRWLAEGHDAAVVEYDDQTGFLRLSGGKR